MSLAGLLSSLIAAWVAGPNGVQSEPRRQPRIDPIPPALGMKVSAEAVAMARAGSSATPPLNLYTTRLRTSEEARRTFAPARPLPGVVPEDVREVRLAMDEYDTGLMGAYNAQFNGGGGGEYGEGLHWLGYPYLAELSQRGEYRRIVETTAREMTRSWLKVTKTGGEDAQRVEIINNQLKHHRVKDKFRRAAELDGYFGRGHIYLDMGVSVDDPEILKTALIMDHRLVERNSLKNIKVVEPSWTYPGMYNSVNPLARDFYHPTTWYVMSREIHSTRLLTFVSRAVPDILKPAYAFGGLSMSQMVKPYVDKWLRTQESVSDLIHSFSTLVLSTDMSSILSGGAGEAAALRALLLNAYRDNRGLLMIDKDKEALENIQTSLGTLDHLQAQAQEHMASISGEPLVIMTGISPSGLNASSEGELQVWAQTVNAMQTHVFDDNIKTVLDVIQLDQFGDIDPGISHEWNPLEEESDQDKSSRRKSEADAHAAYITAGVLDPSEIRQVLASDPESPYAGVDLSGPPPTPPEAEADPLGAGAQEGAGGGGAAGGGTSSGAAGGPPRAPAKPLKPGDSRGVRDAAEGDTIDEIAKAIVGMRRRAAPVGNRKIAADKEFDESDVKRDSGGKFAKSASGAMAGAEFHKAKAKEYVGIGGGNIARPHNRAVKHYTAAAGHYAAGNIAEGDKSHAEAEAHAKSAHGRELKYNKSIGKTKPEASKAEAAKLEAASSFEAPEKSSVEELKTQLSAALPWYAMKDMQGVLDNWDKLTAENKPKVESKIMSMLAALWGGEPEKTLKAIDPIIGTGMSVAGVNSALAKTKHMVTTVNNLLSEASYGAKPESSPTTGSESYTPTSETQKNIFEKLSKVPHYRADHVNYYEDATGKELRAVLRTNTKLIPGGHYAKVSSAYGKDKGNGNTPDVGLAMAEYGEEQKKAWSGPQKDALSSYKGIGYRSINKTLLGVEDSEHAKGEIDHINEVLKTAVVPAATPVYRGLNASLKDLTGFDNPEHAIGRSFEHKNFASVSRSKSVSEGFGYKTMLHFIVPAGSPGIVLGSQAEGEKEIVLPSRSIFRVDKVADGITHVTWLGVREDE